jgi:PAS domain-containing protein
MNTSPHTHEVMLQEIQQEFAAILAQTNQGIYIYQDDPHWICNDKLATILGYASAKELIKLSSGTPILDALVASSSHSRVVEAYRNTVNGMVASSIPVTWKKKGGGTVDSQTIFVPISFKGNLLALHFITPA